MATRRAPYDPVKDGLSYSTLSKWMECREKAKLHLEGWTPRFKSFPLTFGIVVHEILFLGYEGMRKGKFQTVPDKSKVKRMIKKVEKDWQRDNPKASKTTIEQFELALLFSEAVLPVYFDFWFADRLVTFKAVERSFRVQFPLPDGTKIPIIGRRDAAFTRKGKGGLWVTETKTGSRIDLDTLITLLPIEQQTMLYCVTHYLETGKYPAGVLYNIIRRPSLRQGQKESIAQFAKRCAEDVDERRTHYFMRLEMAVSKKEIDKAIDDLSGAMMEFVRWHKGESPHYMSTNQCQGKYGRCEFLGACASRDFRLLYMRRGIK